MEQPRVSIIIINWNGLKDTDKCLNSLKNITYPDYEVIVVDNCSSSDDANILKSRYGEYIRLIRNEKNMGFAGGNNVAIKKILEEEKSKYILLLNNDTTVKSDFLSELVGVAENDSNIGVATAKLFNPDGSIQRAMRRFPTPIIDFLTFCVPKVFLSSRIKDFIATSFLRKLLGDKIGSYFWSFEADQPKEIDNASGACLLVKRETVTQIGLLDEKFFMSSEDIDWSFRAKKAGWKIVYVPTSQVVHYVGKSFPDRVKKLLYLLYKIESQYYYAQKHYTKIELLETNIILILAMILRLPIISYYYIFRQKNDLVEKYEEVFIKLLLDENKYRVSV